MDTTTDEVKKLSVTIASDKPLKRPVYKNVTENIESFAASPSANRILFSARGELFSVPKKYGDVRQITHTPGRREYSVDWAPDGSYISYLTEEPGDYELFIRDYNNNGEEVQLTQNSECWITGYKWSPDNKKILVSDKKLRLRMVAVASKESELMDKGTYSTIDDYCWSPDSRWIAYSKTNKNYLSSIWLYSLTDNKKIQLTDASRDNYSPVFGLEGGYIYFISRRDYNWGGRDFDAKLYVGTLQFDMDNPFAPKSDEVEKDTEVNDKKDSKDKDVVIEIDVKGFKDRVKAIPVKTGRYRNLKAVKGGIIYLRDDDLYKFDMEKREELLIMEKVRTFYLSSDRKNIVYRSGDMYGIIPVASDQKPGTGKLDLKDLVVKIDPNKEFNQIFRDAWRIMRDWFYDPGMHGVDWYKMYDKYSVLVPYAVLRSDFDYIIGEMIGELNAGHCYVHAGDNIEVERVQVGLLGCELVSGGEFYKIDNIFPGRNWNRALRSPLTESGINVSEGEYLIGIDNNIITTDDNPYKYLEHKVGKTIKLRLNVKPAIQGSRVIEIRPIESESGLRHLQWVQRNQAIVDSLSKGRVGYIYVPNTSFNGFESFYKGWQEQFVKDGLVIDERYNGGGSIPAPMVFDMSHPVLNYWARRNLPLYPTPLRTHEGPKIMLINGRSSSGGDAFPAYFRKMDLGPLMGKTTWGGLIGYSYSPHFVDGGGMAVPSFAYVNTEGEWDVEYYGVEPDMEVFDNPALIQAGREPMLKEAVKYILEQLEKNPPEKVEKPEGPDRS
ncbi:MAG: PDZ domain-containing protein [bacterium]